MKKYTPNNLKDIYCFVSYDFEWVVKDGYEIPYAYGIYTKFTDNLLDKEKMESTKTLYRCRL